MNKIGSFLVINPYGIGDVLFSTPILSSIKAYYPPARVYYLCNQRTYDIIKDHPDIDGVFVYERDEFIRIQQESFWAWLKKWKTFISEIKRAKIEVALDFSLNTGIGAIPFMAGIRHRIGLNYKRRGKFLTDAIAIPGFEGRHVAEHYLDVLQLLDIPRATDGLTLGINAQARVWAQTFLMKQGIDPDDLVIGIAPCGGEAFGPQAYLKRWPEENFVALINALLKDERVKILLFAGPGEKTEITRMMTGINCPDRCVSLTGTTLVQCVPLIDRCALFISNDTGLLRFADALKKKIIAFFGPVDEKVYGLFPYDTKRCRYMTSDVPCRPCYQKFRINPCERDRACLTNIPVDEVLDTVGELLDNKGMKNS